MKRAIVIGGGFGGMAAALRLCAKGYGVEIIDRCPCLGGRAQVFERDGFRHDAGPTVITAPFLIDELFALFDRKREDYLTLVPLDPWYRFHFPDGETFDYGGSVEQTKAEIARFNPADCAGYGRLVEASKRIFAVGFDQLADRPFHKVGTMIGQVPNMIRIGSHRTVWNLVSSHICDDRLRQALTIQPLLVGGSPFDTSCIYGLIHYLERRWGVHFAKGGNGAIVDALGRLLGEVGIDVRLATTVRGIDVRDGTARGVRLDCGRERRADVIVSNADPGHLYESMIDETHQTWTVRAKKRYARYSMGLFVLFFGTTRRYPQVAHHTIWLGRRYRALLDDVFHRKILTEDFSLYIHRPSATDPSFAPPGCDSFYALAPVPNLEGEVDWGLEAPRMRDRIVAALDRTLLPGLKETVVSDFYMTPADFRNDYLSIAGAGFSIAPSFTQSAWFRFHNKGEGPRNLYLVGAGTHPGAGLPAVLSSAKTLDRIVPGGRGGSPASFLKKYPSRPRSR